MAGHANSISLTGVPEGAFGFGLARERLRPPSSSSPGQIGLISGDLSDLCIT
jgi:hypothetical protein